MITYAISISSFSPHKIEDVKSVLACSAVQKLIFPATLPTAPRKVIRLAAVDAYDVSLVPKEFYKESFVSIPLYGENEIEFDSFINFEEKPIAPNVVSFKFTSDHLQKGIITLDAIKSVLLETIPVFDADDAIIYDTYSIKIPRPNGGYGFERAKRFRVPGGRRHYRLDVEWVTYYSPELLEFIGRDCFNDLKTCAEKVELNGGVLVVLQEEPFDRKNPEHVARKKQAEAELKLDKLIEKA